MSDPTSTTKKLKSKSEKELERLEAAEGGQKAAAPAEPAAAPKAPATESAGVGRNDAEANFIRLSAGLRKRQATASAAGNDALAAKIAARLKELRKITSEAQ